MPATISNAASPNPTIRVVALYRFATVENPPALRDLLERLCGDTIRGILLVAREGVNGTIAGPAEAVERVLAGLRRQPGFADLDVKESAARAVPFHRLKIRIKPEIVTLGRPEVDPVADTGVYVTPQDWNDLIRDPDVVLIDTRNDYEGEIGAFVGAVQPKTQTFRDFPDWFNTHGRAVLDRPVPPKVAMYCTGGIRCEKATAYLRSQGVETVYHLQGGVLRYLETIPEAESLWRGECFVFDERVAVTHGLGEGTHSLCRGCRRPVSPKGRRSPDYVEGVCCDRCHGMRTEDQRQAALERDRQVKIAEARGVAHIGVTQARETKRG